jgi:hypothetical protein
MAANTERQHLAATQERLRAAEEKAERTSDALSRLESDLYGQLIPGVPAARAALEAARARQPHLLVAAALGEEGDPSSPSVADAEAALALAERRLADVREAIRLIREEAQRANDALDAARHARDNAVRAAVLADEATDDLRATFRVSATRTLRLARSLKSAGINLGPFDAHGQRMVILAEPVVIGAPSAFSPDPVWESAIELLKNDSVARLPGLPELESEPDDADVDAVDGTAAEAA